MEREGGRFRARYDALQVFKEAAFVVEAVGNVIEDLHVVIESRDERTKVSLGCRRNDLFRCPANFFLCRHCEFLLFGNRLSDERQSRRSPERTAITSEVSVSSVSDRRLAAHSGSSMQFAIVWHWCLDRVPDVRKEYSSRGT